MKANEMHYFSNLFDKLIYLTRFGQFHPDHASRRQHK